MMDEKKQKRIRIVGLVVLTILVIVGIVLTIYFVQKNDSKNNEKKDYIKAQINQTVSLEKIDFTVTGVEFEPFNSEGLISMWVTVRIDAKEFFTDSLLSYQLRNVDEPYGQEGHKDYLYSGESSTFKVNFVVKDNQELLYLIYAGKIEIALGEAHI